MKHERISPTHDGPVLLGFGPVAHKRDDNYQKRWRTETKGENRSAKKDINTAK